MTATLIGSFSVGDAVPGLYDVFKDVGNGLTALKSSVDGVIGELGNLQSELNSLASDIDSTTAEIIAGPFNIANQNINAAKSALSELQGITDAGDYLDGVIANLNDAITLLESLVPEDYLSDQLASVSAAIDSLQSAVDDFENQLNDLSRISDDVRKQTALLGDIENTLQDASDNALTPIIQFNAALSQLLNSGVFVVHYDGTLQSLGTEVDGVLPGTGIGNDENVVGPVLVVRTANTATLAALKNVFGIS